VSTDAERSVLGQLAAGTGFLALGYGGKAPGTEGNANSPEDGGVDGGTVVVADSGARSRFGSGCITLCSNRLVDADGQRVAFLADAAPPDPTRSHDTIVLDTATGQQTRVPIDGSYGRLAGRYLLYNASPEALVVYDWQAGREVYRVPGVSSGLGNAGASGRADLRSDGLVVFRLASGKGVAWASPAAPFPHRLALPRTYYSGLSIAGDTVLFERARTIANGATSQTAIGTVPLSGGKVRLLAQNTAAAETTAFDGQRAAFFALTCTGRKVVSGRLEDFPTTPKRQTCRLNLTSRLRRRARTLVASYRCKPFTRTACTLTATRARTARTYRIGHRRIRRGTLIGKTNYADNGRLKIRLTRTGRLLLHNRAARLHITAEASIVGGSGSQRRTTTVIARTH